MMLKMKGRKKKLTGNIMFGHWVSTNYQNMWTSF